MYSIYNQADAIVTVTKVDEIYFKPKIQKPILTIPNLPKKDFYQDIKSFDFNIRKNRIISLGRLVKDKGFDILIRAFSKIEQTKEPLWTLHIYGDGGEKQSLEKLIAYTNMQDRVFLHPSTQNVAETMNEHAIFVFPSLRESYGLVLLEALLMGLPSISFNCPNVPAIIESELPGSVILVPEKNEELLKAEIENLMNDENKRNQLIILARNYRTIVSHENVANSWKNLLDYI